MKQCVPLAMLLLAGCAPHKVVTDPVPGMQTTLAVMTADSIANALITRALTAESKLQNPDSTYSTDAEVVANGEVRTEAPRLAGMGVGGHLLLGSSKTSVTSSFIWGSIEYRWIPDSAGGVASSGYATIIVGRLRDGTWRVVHLHSSTIPPPETQQPARPDTTGRAGFVKGQRLN